MGAATEVTTWNVQIHGLYLGKQVLTVEADSEEEAIAQAKQRWHNLFKGVNGAIWRVGLAPEAEDEGE